MILLHCLWFDMFGTAAKCIFSLKITKELHLHLSYTTIIDSVAVPFSPLIIVKINIMKLAAT